MQLILLRHGQTPSNVNSQLDTAFPGAPLTELGQAQAAALPAALGAYPISALFASPLIRTQLTIAPLAAALGREVTVVPGLEEIVAGDLEMKSDPDSLHAYAGTVSAWMRGELEQRMPGGETGQEFLTRFDAAIESAVASVPDDSTIAVVSHGAAIRAFVAVAGRHPHDAGHGLYLQNTGGAVLTRVAAGHWNVELWHGEPFGGAAVTASPAATATDVTAGSEED